jgi:hypothetical protein
MKVPGSVILYAVAAVALGAGAWYLIRRGAAALPSVQDVKDAINPASDKNVVYLGANSLVQWATGNTVDTLGTALASGASNRAGDQAVAPTPIMKPMASPTGEGLSVSEFMANANPTGVSSAMAEFMANAIPTRVGAIPIDGSGGAAFGLYPNPLRSK